MKIILRPLPLARQLLVCVCCILSARVDVIGSASAHRMRDLPNVLHVRTTGVVSAQQTCESGARMIPGGVREAVRAGDEGARVLMRAGSQTERVKGESTPNIRRDMHPAIKGLRPPEHHAGHSIRTKQISTESKQQILNISRYIARARGLQGGPPQSCRSQGRRLHGHPQPLPLPIMM